MNKEKQPLDLNTTTNFITRQVRKNLEDIKTTWFMVLLAVNLIALGFLFAEYKELNRNYEQLQDRYDTNQVYLNQIKSRIKDE